MSTRERLYDPGTLISGTGHALERARARGSRDIEPDDLLWGLLLAVARFGVIDLGPVSLDLQVLGMAFEVEAPALDQRPGYAEATSKVFERAARIARGDGGGPIRPIHLLVALDDPAIPTFARLCAHLGWTGAAWRRHLAAIDPPPAQPRAGDPSPAALPATALASGGELLSTEEAARLLGLHVQTIRGYIRSGRVAAFRIAGQRSLRIRRDDLSDLLQHLEKTAPSAQPVD